AFGENLSATIIWNTIGVRVSAAPSLANTAAIAAPRTTMRLNNILPMPQPHRATCRADHSKNPASSSAEQMMMMATKFRVAIHTGRQGNTGASQRAPSDAQTLGLPDDEDERGNKDDDGEQYDYITGPSAADGSATGRLGTPCRARIRAERLPSRTGTPLMRS